MCQSEDYHEEIEEDPCIEKSKRYFKPRRGWTWTYPQTARLINLWSKEDCLFDTTNEEYRDKGKRHIAMERMRIAMEAEESPAPTVEEIFNKMNGLKIYYCALKAKRESMIKNGVSFEDMPPIKWPHYHAMAFLIDSVIIPKKTRVAKIIPSIEIQSIITSSTVNQSNFTPPSVNQSNFTPSSVNLPSFTPSSVNQQGFTPSTVKQSSFTPSNDTQQNFIPSNIQQQSSTASTSVTMPSFTPSNEHQQSYVHLNVQQPSNVNQQSYSPGFVNQQNCAPPNVSRQQFSIKKRRRVERNCENEEDERRRVNETCNHITTCHHGNPRDDEDDPDALFGKLITNQLRKVCEGRSKEKLKMDLQKSIFDVLYPPEPSIHTTPNSLHPTESILYQCDNCIQTMKDQLSNTSNGATMVAKPTQIQQERFTAVSSRQVNLPDTDVDSSSQQVNNSPINMNSPSSYPSPLN